MDTQRKGAGQSPNCHPRHISNAVNNFIESYDLNITTKRRRLLAGLLCASECGYKLTRFDAEILGCHCFNTTVSEIGRLDGIEVLREWTKVPTRFGKDTDCKRYWLDRTSLIKAKKQLGVNHG